MRIIYNPAAKEHLFNIYDATEEKWGETQADTYLSGLYETIGLTAKKQKVWRKYLYYHENLVRPIYYVSYKKHFVFFEALEEENAIIVLAIFHSAMDIPERLKDVRE
jgi:plasmid stabilization system protein ParE